MLNRKGFLTRYWSIGGVFLCMFACFYKMLHTLCWNAPEDLSVSIQSLHGVTSCFINSGSCQQICFLYFSALTPCTRFSKAAKIVFQNIWIHILISHLFLPASKYFFVHCLYLSFLLTIDNEAQKDTNIPETLVTLNIDSWLSFTVSCRGGCGTARVLPAG